MPLRKQGGYPAYLCPLVGADAIGVVGVAARPWMREAVAVPRFAEILPGDGKRLKGVIHLIL